MKSVIIKGEVNKYGLVSVQIQDPRAISLNEWAFRFSSCVVKPINSDLKAIFEIGCSMNSSVCYDYNQKTFLDKNTPVCLLKVNSKQGETQIIDFSESSCPFIKIEHVKNSIEVSFKKPGTNLPIEDKIEVMCHMWLKRL